MLLGYGEDALTLWVLESHLERLLHVLRDDSDVSTCIALYRPSFGRRGSSVGEEDPAKYRSAFGEFDAIVGTPVGTYLLESKWSASPECKGACVALRPAQIRRHAIMRCYIEEWRTVRPRGWREFLDRSKIRERLRPLRAAVAPPGSRLARNLSSVLGLLCEFDSPVRDVVLFFRAESDWSKTKAGSPPTEVEQSNFSLVGVDCRTAELGGYFALPAGASLPKADMWLSQIQEGKRQIAAR